MTSTNLIEPEVDIAEILIKELKVVPTSIPDKVLKPSILDLIIKLIESQKLKEYHKVFILNWSFKYRHGHDTLSFDKTVHGIAENLKKQCKKSFTAFETVFKNETDKNRHCVIIYMS